MDPGHPGIECDAAATSRSLPSMNGRLGLTHRSQSVNHGFMGDGVTLWSRRSKSELLFATKQWVLYAICSGNILQGRLMACEYQGRSRKGPDRVQGKRSQAPKRRAICAERHVDRAPSSHGGFAGKVVLEFSVCFFFPHEAHLAFFLSSFNLPQLVTSLNLTFFQRDLSNSP